MNILNTATIYFSDGNTLKVKEGEIFTPINSYPPNIDKKELNFASQGKSIELWNHIHDGLIPSVLELLFNSEYFCKLGNPSIVYNSKSVTRIEAD